MITRRRENEDIKDLYKRFVSQISKDGIKKDTGRHRFFISRGERLHIKAGKRVKTIRKLKAAGLF